MTMTFNTSGRDASQCNKLERYLTCHLITCQKVQLPAEHMLYAEVCRNNCQAHCNQPIRGIMCGLYITIHPHEQGWNKRWLYVFYMIGQATSWFEIIELPESKLFLPDFPMGIKGHKSTNAHKHNRQPYFMTWFCRYPCSQYLHYDYRSEFKLHFPTLCNKYGIKRKPTSVKNSQANAILKWVHQESHGNDPHSWNRIGPSNQQ